LKFYKSCLYFIYSRKFL